VDRRAFLGTLAASLLAAPLAAEGQPRVPVVGVLASTPGPRSGTVNRLREHLREAGHFEIAFEVRFAGGKPEAFPDLVGDLIRRKVDVLFAMGPAAIRAARDATGTIPIVALDLETDPVQGGFARSLAQPGGNITGFFLDLPGPTGKWLDLVREAAPGVRRISLLWDSTTGPWQLAAAKAAVQRFGMDLQVIEVRSSGDFDKALSTGAAGKSTALIQLSSPIVELNSKRTAEFALKHRLPAISMFARFVEAGGLMIYGPTPSEYVRRVATYIDKVLKGARPRDLPIEQPTKFELVINLKTAKALGLMIPPSLLQRADQVIE
jgi:putative ABC transport system substrate-binding protein